MDKPATPVLDGLNSDQREELDAYIRWMHKIYADQENGISNIAGNIWGENDGWKPPPPKIKCLTEDKNKKILNELANLWQASYEELRVKNESNVETEGANTYQIKREMDQKKGKRFFKRILINDDLSNGLNTGKKIKTPINIDFLIGFGQAFGAAMNSRQAKEKGVITRKNKSASLIPPMIYLRWLQWQKGENTSYKNQAHFVRDMEKYCEWDESKQMLRPSNKNLDTTCTQWKRDRRDQQQSVNSLLFEIQEELHTLNGIYPASQLRG